MASATPPSMHIPSKETMSEEELRIFNLYGKLPSSQEFAFKKLQDERKYFDSGDYAMYRAGHASATVGSKHPSPETIPRPSPPHNLQTISFHHPHPSSTHSASSTISNSSSTASPNGALNPSFSSHSLIGTPPHLISSTSSSPLLHASVVAYPRQHEDSSIATTRHIQHAVFNNGSESAPLPSSPDQAPYQTC